MADAMRRHTFLLDKSIRFDTFFAVSPPSPRPLRTFFFMTEAGNEPVYESPFTQKENEKNEKQYKNQGPPRW